MSIELNRIHNTPCLDMFAGLQEQAALIVADPPYGISYKSGWTTKFSGDNVRNKDCDPREHFPDDFDDSIIDVSWLQPAYASLKHDGAMYLFTRWDVLANWKIAAEAAGFKVVQRIVWNKAHWGAGNLDYFGSQTEDILFCVKGPHALNWDKREGNVWYVPRANTLSYEGGGKHPTQKPVRLFDRIIQYSSDKNDLILDPFTGSGAACIAAQRLHRRFIGCDISPTFAVAAQAWIEDDARTSSLVRTIPMF